MGHRVLQILRILLLGPFLVERDGEPIPDARWPNRQTKRLLKLLALSPNHRIHIDQAMEILWPDLPAEAQANNLARTVFHLRRTLEPELEHHRRESRFVTREEEMLCLSPADELWIDVEEFKALVRKANAAADPVPLLEAAEPLYRGDLLEEDQYEEWVIPHRRELQERFARVLQALASHYRGRRDYAAAIDTLHRILERDPTDELAHRELMLTFVLAGRRGAALRQYDLCKKALDPLEPEPATDELVQRIKKGEIEPDLRPPDRESIFKVPTPPTPLLGRKQQLAEILQMLNREDVRLLTLTGVGGIGKTRLVQEVATQVRERFTDGIFFVPLASIRDHSQVVSAIAETLEVRESGDEPLPERLQNILRNRHILLVLDNFEHVMAAKSVVADLLAATAAKLKILVTSRELLHLRGEHKFEVPLLEQDAAVQLFEQSAQRVDPNFTITDKDVRAVDRICARLDRLPLAIELAAAAVTVLSLQEILERLSSRLYELPSPPDDLDDHQRTLRVTIDWSFNLLSAGEQALFRRLAIFRGGCTCTLEAAERVCNVAGDLPLDLVDGLAALVNKSLLQREKGSDGEPRFGMLEIIGDYARERLVNSGEAEAMHREHARFFLALAEEEKRERWGAREAASLRRLELVHANLRAALQWSGEREETEMVLRLIGALWWFWWITGRLSEGQEWVNAALVQSEEAPDLALARARALRGAGVLAWGRCEYERAESLLQASLAQAQELGDEHGYAIALNYMGSLARDQGSYERAEELFKQSLQLFRALGNKWGVAMQLDNLGDVAIYRGKLERGRRLIREGLKLRQALDLKWAIAGSLLNLARIARYQGDFERAAKRARESLAMYWAVGATWDVPQALELLAAVVSDQEQLLEGAQWAATLLGAAKGLRNVTGYILPKADRADYDQTVAKVCKVLGRAAFEQARDRGEAMMLEQAISYALGGLEVE